MTRVVLIQAAPTPWDEEGRLSGRHTLPLTDEARASIGTIVAGIDFPVHAVYRAAANEATDQAAKIVAHRFHLRPRDAAALDEVKLGLWQGLRGAEVRSRFPSAFARWQEDAPSVKPPEGESLAEAIERLRGALGKVLRRNHDHAVVLALRPMAMQIVAGILRLERPEQIGAHLHNRVPVETIDIADEDLLRYTG
jgi:broad specificity phosphatase PhoE